MGGEQLTGWPPLNYNNPPPHPETRRALLLGIEAPLTALALLFVGARFYSRTYIKRVIGWDDYCMLAAALFAATVTMLHCYGTKYAIGFHITDVHPSWIKPTAKITWGSLVLYAPTASLAKISICLSYLRLFPSTSDRRFAQFGIAFSVLYCIIVTVLNIVQCLPIHAYWEPVAAWKCINREALTIASQAVNSLSDFLIFLWPARTLSGIRLPPAQRFGLIFVFSIGVIICIAGVFRIWYLTVYFDSYDIFYEGATVFILAGIETNVGIICGSLPGCKPLLASLFPRVFGSNYSTMSQNRYVLPGQRMSLRFPPEERVYLPPERTSSTISMESVPVKLEVRQSTPDSEPWGRNMKTSIAILTPVPEAWSPTVSERMHERGATSWFIENERDTP
ncbi:hypothetical protein EJ08DRAFT_696998 [Tothia fuscella]|uniref:Rhodopsin domain-containing protein n=1 Tax=Tothia fuscella TaxID=1048955 RepID=A0A9P4NSA3_9PEZI|nr:hypothetical protein EJ08DRAFT_696998 [Tothia fuscella]